MQLSQTEQKYLLRIARSAIEEHLAARSGDRPGAPQEEPPSEKLLDHCGAFVTLRMPTSGELRLRGCMGVVVPTHPLVESVRDSAVSAAFRDPRFPPLAPEELDACTIEISVLSPMIPCTPEEVEPGRDGVMISYGPASGLLLPQVAVEQCWDRSTFLSHVCRKAGAAPDCWRDPRARLHRFTAIVFSESAG
ncbi:MAG: AmmeMemoRadiSam system protein A [bacterium]